MNNYIEWASSVEGIGKIAVKPLWNGNGTVKVIIADTNNDPASEELIKKVANYIETQRPIGATVTVVSFTTFAVNISLKVTKGDGNAEGIKKAVDSYFKSDDFDGTTISYAQIGKVILNNTNETKTMDYIALTINGSSENIILTDEEMPIVEGVTLNA